MNNIQQDYLNGQHRLRDFYNYPIQDLDFEEIIKNKSFSQESRDRLATRLEEQYKNLPINPFVAANIEKLRSSNTYTITTGHQLCFLGGPLFTIYKILTVINLCEALNNHYANHQFVPIFWIHTEDHDFAEINHYFANFSEKKTYKGVFTGAVGNHIINDSITALLPLDFPENLKKAYEAGKTWTQAYMEFFHELFQEYGLVMLDADDASLKASFSPIIEQEIKNQFSFFSIEQTNKALTKTGYKTQIEAREINLFYMDAEGRNRIEKKGEIFEVKNREIHFTEAELLELAQTQPEKFSPNVCLRPLYQEMILPNLAYVGGWAEVSYWLQLKGVFDAANVPFPAVIPRFSATLWRKEEAKKWKSLDLSKKEIGLPSLELRKKILFQYWNRTAWEMQKEMVLQKIEGVQGFINTQTPTLPNKMEGFKKKALYYLNKAEKSLFKQIELQQKDVFMTFENTKNKVQPDNAVQERVLNMAAFPDFPPSELIDIIKTACNPLSFEHTHIILD